ncbi:MAG: prolipoprotein diacylglyceryl transferase [Actinomycetota bacterium]|nr:prolipoprotein diacylglyceryl transferase [Actinomycetota bacterium]
MRAAPVLASIPSPPSGVWYVGPFPLRAYALCILLGVVVAVVLGERRWVARGGERGTVTDIATFAVPAGIVGARLYHVVTSPARYLEEPVAALYVWQGGLGIPGGVLGGALAVWFVCRRRGLSTATFGDAVAPGVALAQAVGRLGNWFNQELFGRPTDLPWGLEIDPRFRPDRYADVLTFHPTFLYELLWNVGVAVVLLWADRRFRLGHGRVFALYLALYAVGRAWIEALRIDEATLILGVRLNDWTMAIVFLGAVTFLWLRRGRGREDSVRVAEGEQPPVPSDA